MKSITSISEGRVVARSKNYGTHEDAERVANWINGLALTRGSLDVFSAAVVQNSRTKRPAFYVELEPLAPSRREQFRAMEHAKRAIKAREEGARYDFLLLGEVDGVPHASVITCSGETYTVCADGFCTCEDRKKIAPLGLDCKHSLTARHRGVWSQK